MFWQSVLHTVTSQAVQWYNLCYTHAMSCNNTPHAECGADVLPTRNATTRVSQADCDASPSDFTYQALIDSSHPITGITIITTSRTTIAMLIATTTTTTTITTHM